MRTEKKTIGFIGTGVMGKRMAGNLMKAGFPLHVYTRTKQKAQQLIEAGAIWEDTVKSLAKNTDVIITIVGYPDDVEEVYFGENGILENAKENTVVIDMTTSKPQLAEKIYKAAKQKSIHSLDAPVTGSDVKAENGTLSIMAGGDEKVFHEMLPVFKAMGENIIYHGLAGSGQHTKLTNQIIIASSMIGIAEAISYARKAGLNPERVLDSISSGAAGSFVLSNFGARILKGDFEPGFYVKHFIKDMIIALESAEELGLSTPGLALSLKLYKELAEAGHQDSGIQALIKLFEKEVLSANNI